MNKKHSYTVQREFKIRIKHHIPGRLRLRIPGVYPDSRVQKDLSAWLSSRLPDISVDARPVTGSIIFQYSPGSTEKNEILALLSDWCSEFTVCKQETHKMQCDTHCIRCEECTHPDRKPSLLRQSLGLVFITGYVIYAFIKRSILGKPVSEGPLSITALVATGGAWPLLKQSFHDLRQGRFRTLFPFLSTVFIAALLVGEAFTALEVVWILRLGMLLEDYVSERSRQAVGDILKLTERDAYVLVDGVEVATEPALITKGDIVVCHTGEKIPVDGMVQKGEALVDTSPVTGRAEPEEKRPGDEVFAGTIVSQGIIYIKAEKVGDETYLCRIMTMVEGALKNRAPAEQKADQLAERLMRISVVAVIGTFLITFDPLRAFTVMLVLACPCATVLAASTAVSAALANAARNHILIKGGLYLENIGSAKVFCFDKTGTITSEIPRLVNIVTRTHTQSADSVLSLAAAAEVHNRHPVALAIMDEAQRRGIEFSPHTECEFRMGRGVRALLDGHEILVGNPIMMQESGVKTDWFRKRMEREIRRGHTVVFVSRDRKAQGMLVVANSLRPEAKSVLDFLRKDGVMEIHLISGDAEPVVKNMALELDFDEYVGDMLPEDKAAYIKRLEHKGRRTVMIGDGINDALALAESSIGVAMGAGGAEVAIETADIALVDSDLRRITDVRRLSRKTMEVIEQNHFIAMATNIGGVFLGAAGLLSPVMAGALHVIHTLGILVNSGRLTVWNLEQNNKALEVNSSATKKKLTRK